MVRVTFGCSSSHVDEIEHHQSTRLSILSVLESAPDRSFDSLNSRTLSFNSSCVASQTAWLLVWHGPSFPMLAYDAVRTSQATKKCRD